MSAYASAAVIERAVWGNPETFSGFHEDKVIVIIILRHFLPFFAVSIFALMVQKQRQGKLLVLSTNEGSGFKLYWLMAISFFISMPPMLSRVSRKHVFL